MNRRSFLDLKGDSYCHCGGVRESVFIGMKIEDHCITRFNSSLHQRVCIEFLWQ